MTAETEPLDLAEVLIDSHRIAAYLDEAFADGDPAFIVSAVGDVARARNITAIARDTLYRAFSSGGNPTLAIMAAVVKALGFQFSIKPLVV